MTKCYLSDLTVCNTPPIHFSPNPILSNPPPYLFSAYSYTKPESWKLCISRFKNPGCSLYILLGIKVFNAFLLSLLDRQNNMVDSQADGGLFQAEV